MTPALTEEQNNAIRLHILLPMLLTVLERDKELFQEIKVKFPDSYLMMIDIAKNLATDDLFEADKLLRESGIKIRTEGTEEYCYQVKYTQGGYYSEYTISRHILAAEVSGLMDGYLKGKNKQ